MPLWTPLGSGARFCSFRSKFDTISGHFGPYLDLVRDHCHHAGEGIFGNSCTKRWRSIWPVWRRTRKVAQNKAGPKQMEPEGSTHISQWGAFGGLRCNAARRLRGPSRRGLPNQVNFSPFSETPGTSKIELSPKHGSIFAKSRNSENTRNNKQ